MRRKVTELVQYVVVKVGGNIVGDDEWLVGDDDVGEVVKEMLEPYAYDYDINPEEIGEAVRMLWRALGGAGEEVAISVPGKGIFILTGTYETEIVEEEVL